MAIQFTCVACGKPMEVDDQWARQLVECPYCHDTVTAPAYSSYQATETSDAVVARPLDEPTAPAMEAWTAPVGAVEPAGSGSATLAVVALVCACLSVVGMVATGVLFVQQADAAGWLELPPEELQRVVTDAGEQGAHWVVQLSLFMFGSCLFWLVAVVLGLIAVFRPKGRGIAIAALAIAGLPLVLTVFSALAGGM